MNSSLLTSLLSSRRREVDAHAEISEAVGVGAGAELASSLSSSSAGKKNFFSGDFVDRATNHGFAGLTNQGATCYLNSLLQALFMTPDFRRSVYAWPYSGAAASSATDADAAAAPSLAAGEARNMARQLQRLFACMQCSERGAVRTTELTKAFGWDRDEVRKSGYFFYLFLHTLAQHSSGNTHVSPLCALTHSASSRSL